MDLKKIKHIHFIGIGGIGTSALAQIFHEQGKIISGSDQNRSELIRKLQKKGIKVAIGHDEQNIKQKHELVIYSPAIPKNNPELKKAKELKIPTKSYPQALGQFSNDYFTIAISGTHGKSTTTAMIARILIEAKFDPSIVIGTKMHELKNQNYRRGQSRYLIIEACEYKEAFLNYHPDMLIITNIEADHLDYYKNENNYLNAFKKLLENVPKNGKIIINGDDKNSAKVIKNIAASKKVRIISTEDSTNTELNLKIPGDFNKKNAAQAHAVASLLEITEKQSKKSLETFTGTWRRMQIKKTKLPKTKFIDDYAHHPTEIKATLKAIRQAHKQAKILCVFQPHQHSRTKLLMKEFGKAFKNADKVIIPNIYAVRDTKEDSEGISTDKLVSEIKKHHKFVQNGHGLKETAAYIKENYKNFDIIITMGAGDIESIYKYL